MGVHVHTAQSQQIYLPRAKKSIALSHSERWKFQFEVGSGFPPGVHFLGFRTNLFCALSTTQSRAIDRRQMREIEIRIRMGDRSTIQDKRDNRISRKLKSKTPFKSWFYPVGLGGDGQHAPQGEGEQEAEAGQPQRQARHLRPVNLIILRTKIMHKNVLQH